MATERRPELKIKVYPEDLVNSNKLQVLQKLRKTNALILNLTENIKGKENIDKLSVISAVWMPPNQRKINN